MRPWFIPILAGALTLGTVACVPSPETGANPDQPATPPAAATRQPGTNPTPYAMPTTAPAPVPTQASNPQPSPATRGPNDPPSPWTELDFEPAGDLRQTFNLNADAKPVVFLTWFHVQVYDPSGKAQNLGACSLRITTASDGERVSTPGAYREFGLPNFAQYSPDQLHELVRWWLTKLESEPRGACGQSGDYLVSWQDASMAPANATKGRP